MKTHEEIKKGLECECAQSCQGCPYREEGSHDCSVFLHNDIYDLIQQLEQRCDAAQMNASSAIRELAEVRLKCLKQIEAIAKKVPKWISVEERLPEEGREVLASVNGGFCVSHIFGFDMMTGEPEWTYTGLGADPDHWMPLPSAPKEG